MSLTVRNTQRVAFVLNLLAKTKVPPRKGDEAGPYAPTKFSMETTVEPRAGREAEGAKLVEKLLPASITWLPGETKKDLPEGITEIEEFKRAKARRQLVVVEEGKPEPRQAGEPKRTRDQDAPKPEDETSHRTGENA